MDVLETVVDYLPELRVCAFALRQARRIGLPYPIADAVSLAKLLDRDSLIEAGYYIDFDDIVRLLPEQYYPIEHEGDLVSRVYISLIRSREELSVASRVEEETIERLRRITTGKRKVM